MITTVTNNTCFEFRGLSTDTKPTDGVGNGSTFFEMDTSKVFMLKVVINGTTTTKTWVEI